MKRREFVLVVIIFLFLSVVFPKIIKATADGMNIEKGYATASDGTRIYFEVHGNGPFLFLGPPLTASPVPNQDTPIADAYIKELSGKYRVIVADYPRGYGKTPSPEPETVTGDSVTADLLAIADAAGAEKFAWFGFSWGGVVGLQLAHRSDRLSALICGGWPPLGGPYDKMREVTQKMVDEWPYGEDSKAYKAMSQGFAYYYKSIKGWKERKVVSSFTFPRLTFAGENDRVELLGITAEIAATIRKHEEELEKMGWVVRFIPDQDHSVIARADLVAPVIRDFLDSVLSRK